MNPFEKFLAKYLWLFLFFLFVMLLTLAVLYFSCDIKYKQDHLVFHESNFPAIRVVVYNGCGFVGVASHVREYLSEKNVDVVSVGNTRKFVHKESLIVVKQYDEIDLKRLKRITGIPNVIFAINEDFNVPFIIIAGRDYQRYFRL